MTKPIRKTEDERDRSRFGGVFGAGARARDVTSLTHKLAVMLAAGVPVVQSLRSLARRMPKGALGGIVHRVCAEIEDGASLSEALARHPRVFDACYVRMARVGEAGGILAAALEHLADARSRGESLRRRLLTALIYPLFCFACQVALMVLLMMTAFARLEIVFLELNCELPLITCSLVEASRQLRQYWFLLPAIPLGFLLLFKLATTSRTGRYWVDWLKMRSWRAPWDGVVLLGVLPGLFLRPLSGILYHLEMGRLFRALGLLLRSGVSFTDALELAGSGTRNSVVAEAVAAIRKDLESGESVTDAFRGSNLTDDFANGLIEVGDHTGGMSGAFLKLADYCEGESQRRTDELTRWLQPAAALLVGACVAYVALALLAPILYLDPGLRP